MGMESVMMNSHWLMMDVGSLFGTMLKVASTGIPVGNQVSSHLVVYQMVIGVVYPLMYYDMIG